MLAFRNLILLGCVVFLCAALSSCWEENPTYSHLLLHPEYLQRSYNQCVQQVTDVSLPCELIMRAQADFTDLINQREQDPERFGAQVMQAQENTIYLKARFEAASRAYRKVGRAKPSVEVFMKMRLELDKRRAAYRASEEQVSYLLSVIAATSSL